MFGLFRILLVIFVLIAHFCEVTAIGAYGVFGFYILSGYLMTTIMHRSYGYNRLGRTRFAVNRFLRLYPNYWAAILVAIFLLLVFGDVVTEFKSIIYLPPGPVDWIKNILIILPAGTQPRLSPATWALTVEIFYYIAICIGASKSIKLTWAWLAVGVLYVAAIFVVYPDVWHYRYFQIPAASLPFSVGALIYHYKKYLTERVIQIGLDKPLTIFLVICANYILFEQIDRMAGTFMIMSLGFYINLFLMAVMIVALMVRGFPGLTRKIDTEFGKYSYPIYLVHWQAGAIFYIIMLKMQGDASKTGMLMLLGGSIISIIISYLMVTMIDVPIERLRTKVKKTESTGAN